MGLTVWFLAIALALAGLAGVLVAPAMIRRPGLHSHSIAFAAGVLLTVVLAHVVPEAMASDPRYGGALIMLGFVGMMLLQRNVLKADPCCGHEHAKHAGLPSYLALVACSINDGIIVTTHQAFDHPLIWAMCAHKVTSSFALVLLLRETSGGAKSHLQTLYLLLYVAVTPVTLLLATKLEGIEHSMHLVVAVGAGALLYVICGGMVPRVEHLARERKSRVLFTFLVAAVITILVEVVAPHHHVG